MSTHFTALTGGIGGIELTQRTWGRLRRHGVLDQSARLSFYFLLSLFPLLMFLMALLGLALQSGDELQQMVRTYLLSIAPESASSLIDDTMNEISQGGGAARISFALLFAWWPASRGMLSVIDGLNVAYRVSDPRPWWKKYLVASGLTLAGLVLLSTALVMLLYGDRLTAMAAESLNLGDAVAQLWSVGQWCVLLVTVLAAFNLVYIFAPNVPHRDRRWLTLGSAVGVALWVAGSLGFKLYLAWFDSYSVMYGSVGAVIVLMMWLYISGIAVLVGAEVNAEIEEPHQTGDGRKRSMAS